MIPFKYSRKREVQKKDASGNPIPLKIKKLIQKDENDLGTEVEEVVPGKFETEIVWKTDHINLDMLIRTHELDDGRVIVLLNDGHEESQKVPIGLKNAKKGMIPNNINYEKQVTWVQSEITLEKKEDIDKLYEILESYQ